MHSHHAAVAFVLLFSAATGGAAAERDFLSGYAGSLPKDARDRARTWFNIPAVRGILARLESGSLSEPEITTALTGSDATLADLMRMRLLRNDGDRYSIGFAYFTADDMRVIYKVADRVGPSLAAAYVARRKNFDRIFAAYPVKSVARSKVAFVLLTGFCLNWNGLEVTRDLGYRRPIMVEGEGFRYSFWASEEVAGRDYRGVIWGSSTLPGDEYSFSSFGDPDSDPRLNFPDLFYLDAATLPDAVRRRMERVGLHPNTDFGRPAEQVLGGALQKPVITILTALRGGPRSARSLARLTGHDIGAVLDLLQEIDYVGLDKSGLYHLRVPVFIEADRAMIDRTLALNRSIMKSWLASHDLELRRDLGSLAAIRAGLPFEALFTQIWHEVFGVVTRELIDSRLVADPYSAEARSKGSFATVWRTALYRRTPG